MADLHQELDRESERFALAPGFLERVYKRKRRRELRRRIGTAAIALVFGGTGAFGAFQALRGGEPQPATTPTPNFGAIAGTYRMTLTNSDPGVGRNGMAGSYAMTLHADGRIELTLPAPFASATRLGIHPGGYVYRITGDRFTTNLFVNGEGCPEPQGVGVYRWSRTGGVLEFRVIQDTCGQRRTLLTTVPWRSSG